MIVIIIDGRWSRERQRGISVRRLGIAGFFGPNWGCVSHIAIQRRDERQESQDEAADGTRGEHHHLFDFPARRMLLPCYPRAVSTRQRSCGAPSQPESESPQDSLKLLLDRGSHKAVSRQWLLPPDALTFASRQELGAISSVFPHRRTSVLVVAAPSGPLPSVAPPDGSESSCARDLTQSDPAKGL